MTAIMVLGQGRSGTSAVAGVLHYLGVYMGQGLLPSTQDNAKGSFEDARFHRFNLQFVGGDVMNPRPNPANMAPWGRSALLDLVTEMDRHEIWGLKAPLICFTFRLVLPFLPNPTYIIHTLRAREHIVDSVARVEGMGAVLEAARIVNRYETALLEARAIVPPDWPQLYVAYDRLVEEPAEQVERIAAFVGLPVTKEAIDFVDPKLRHWR